MKFKRILSFCLAAASSLAIGTVSGASDRARTGVGAVVSCEQGNFKFELNSETRTAAVTEYDEPAESPAEVTVPAAVTAAGTEYIVTSIGQNAFSGVDAEKVIVPEGVTAIDQAAFSSCFELAEIELPSTLTTLGVRAFTRCKALRSVRLPEGVRAVPSGLFAECTALRHVDLPARLEMIQTKAFEKCTSLTSITIPGTITQLNDDVFQDAASSMDVAFLGTPLQWDEITGDTEKWIGKADAARRVEVTCQLPENTIDRDVIYSPVSGVWTAVLQLPVPPAWSLSRQGLLQVRTAQRSGQRSVMEIPLTGPIGTAETYTVTAKHASEHVTATANRTVKLEAGWTPQDTASWVTLSSSSVTSGDEVQIMLRPLDGAVSSELSVCSGSTGTMTLTSGSSKCATSSDGQYHMYSAKVTAPNAGELHLNLSGSFSHDKGHGTFDAKLPVIHIAAVPQPTVSKAPEPTPTPTAALTPSPTPVPTVEPSATPSMEQTPTRTAEPSPSSAETATVSPTPSPTETPEPSPSASDPAPPKLKDDSDLLIAGVGGDSMLKGTMPNGTDLGLDAGSLKDQFDIDHGIFVEILDHSGARVADNMPLATGYEIVFRRSDNGAVISRIPIVVQGDVCGTGFMTLTQLVRHAQGYTEVRPLVGCYLSAGDFNDSGRLELSDLVQEARLYRRER